MVIVRRLAGTLAAIAAGMAAGCGNEPRLVLTQHVEVRRLVADLRVQFSKASAAANLAVMADTDQASSAAAREAERATQAAEQDVAALAPILKLLSYRDEQIHLDSFTVRFAQYRALNAEILSLTVENTNIKAQRMSFGPAREAVRTFRESLDAAARTASSGAAGSADVLAARAALAVLETHATQARHIAEADNHAMALMEAEMAASAAVARRAVDALRGLLPESGPSVAAAAAALDRFMAMHAEIVALSRRNTNVRSLALSLGRQRTVTEQCAEILQALEDALAHHELAATR